MLAATVYMAELMLKIMGSLGTTVISLALEQ